MKTNLRHIWAFQKLAVKPEDSLLKIGCGYGITAALVASQLESGKLDSYRPFSSYDYRCQGT